MKTLDGVNIIGLTGQSGAGKSTASKFFAAHGIPVIDCDAVARKIAENPALIEEVGGAFPNCLTDGKLNRQKLAGIVFNCPEKLRRYTSIIFPYIIYEIFRCIRELKAVGERIVVLDAPTLFESGLDEICSAIVSIIAPFELKLKRVLERDGIPVELVRSRISSQHEDEFFSNRSDYLIVNDGDMDALEQKISEVASVIKERFYV